jgi:hypothetical protein
LHERNSKRLTFSRLHSAKARQGFGDSKFHC